MAFPDGFLDELIYKNEITDVVGSYVQLTKKSGNNLFGLCPFHNEKTPSFSVSADKQIYHCFGCGKGGGVINFIMEVEGLNFREAVEFLAKRAGMEMPDDDTPKDVRNRRARILELNRDAAKFYFSVLSSSEGKAAVDYINKRGISKGTATRFGLGAAPDEWTRLCEAMTKKGYTYQELFDAGLCKRGKNGSGFYDTFRNRLMFPVIDIRGSVLGFSGRALGDNEPKYLNSPDTPVFSKSRNLFAMNLAKKTSHDMIILVEGNVDVVSLHQAGFDCAVASLGTSLTPDQARLISRYTKKVVIAYDSDEAGKKATQRAIGILDTVGLEVKVLTIPGAKDPDEFIKANGAEGFKRLLDGSENRIDYRLLTLKSKYDLTTDDGRIAYLNSATDMLSDLPNAVERDVFAVKISEETSVSKDAVLLEINKKRRRKAAQYKKKREQDTMRAANALQPESKALRYENVISAAAEEGVIRLLLLDPTLSEYTKNLSQNDFSSEFLGTIYSIILDRIQTGKDLSPASIAAQLEPDKASHLSLIMQKPESASDGQATMRDYTDKIKTEKLKADMSGDLEAVAKLMRQKKGYGG